MSVSIIYLITHSITVGGEFGKKAEKTHVFVQRSDNSEITAKIFS